MTNQHPGIEHAVHKFTTKPKEACLGRLEKKLHDPVTVFLTNGVKLSGAITEVLANGIILTREGVSQVIFEHAIGTVMAQSAAPEYGNRQG